jgi:methionyl aminopeptidase
MQAGYGNLRGVCGHGIGRDFHELPYVYHYDAADETIMKPGMVFTIEPAICQGKGTYTQWNDGWTIATKDHGRAAQFEHSVLVTDTGVKILTL